MYRVLHSASVNGVACPSPVVGHCCGMVDGVAPSLSCGSDMLVILGLVRRGAPVRLDAGHGGRRAGRRVMTS